MTAIGPQVRIRDLRIAHGFSIPVLVERIKAHGGKATADHISNVELGHKRASNELLVAWAKALGVNPLDITQPDRVGNEPDVVESVPA